jgi:superfamily I DNA/RNA helicase/RecB family exonuclease
MRWRLDLSPSPPAAPPLLDAEQRSVVDHRHGPLLVLAGPGTGKTTTIVEAMCARLSDEDDPVPADGLLALTFGRKAAHELRDRVTARVGGGLVPTVATFHSFAYGLLRRTDTPDEYLAPPRLMSGAEEDVRIRELLRGAVEDGTVEWPEDLAGALPTLGLANEVRAVLSRARELGLEGGDLARIGRRSGRAAWVAVGDLARQEQEVMALENVMDYGELLVRALVRAHEPAVATLLRGQYRAIYVDEYQDTDRLQVALLRALVGPQTALIAVGDPDQSIYGFRGADVRSLLRFPEEFPTAAGTPAPVVVLGHTRRFGPRIRQVAAAALGSRLPVGLAPDVARAHRHPACEPVVDEDHDVVDVRVYDSAGSLAAHVARQIRLAHVQRRIPWQEMAVLVRSGHQLPGMQRALQAAGVPVVVAADEIPLRSEPAVAALLSALSLAAHPGSASAADVLDVITGPMGSLSPVEVRRLGRALRSAAHTAGVATPPSPELIHDLVVMPLLGREGPDLPFPPDDPIAVALRRVGALLAEVRAGIESGAPPEEVLWTLWSGGRSPHGWPSRLRAAALAGSRSADHDLDAVMALFDAAERLAGRYPGFVGVRMFLDSLADQQIPAEAVAERGTRADAVRILTAHRAKGLEWDEVWVVGLQEGVWPDLRARGTTLRAEELTATGIGEGPRSADLLEEERRLFYVACTRARRQLHLAAVDAGDQGGDRPSRFLADAVAAGVEAVVREDVPGRPPHHVSLDGLVAELRRVAAEPSTSHTLRAAAVERLAMLASQRDDAGEPLVPLADPSRWWGVADLTRSERPVRDPQQPLSLSGSGLDSIVGCPLKWFLENEVHAETPRGSATAFGSVIHAVADFVAKGDVPAVLEDMDAAVERIWGELRFEAPWQSESERREARAALQRFLGYHQRADRELVGSESRVVAEVDVPRPTGATETVRLSGYVDRVERDADGRLVPIDLKNMRRPVADKDIPEHGQLGVYQLLLRAGGLRDDDGEPMPVEVGGAALVQLRVDAAKASPNEPKVQFQAALEPQQPTWVEVRLGEAAEILRTERFQAAPGAGCRYCAYRSSCPAQPEGEQVVS